MTDPNAKSELKVPVICCHPLSLPALSLFNANDWTGTSKSVIRSCAVQYGLIRYESARLKQVFDDAEALSLCRQSLIDLQSNRQSAPWDLDRCSYFVEVPELHLNIEAFFSSVKTFLDLLVQLVASEGIVSQQIHGFHKRRDQVGGKFLQALENNASSARKSTASKLAELLVQHKTLWIDDVVRGRDVLRHPDAAPFQVMFQLQLRSNVGKIEIVKVRKPEISGQSLDLYAQTVVDQIQEFSRSFLNTIRDP